MKLEKTMTEFVKEKSKEAYEGLITFNHVGMQSEKYAKFITQELNIGMFVPAVFKNCEWVILEEPNINNFKSEPFCSTGNCEAYRDEVKEYQEAKERVLFKGFQIIGIEKDYCQIELKNSNLWITFNKGNVEIDDNEYKEIPIKKVEELLQYKLELTETGEKQLKGEI